MAVIPQDGPDQVTPKSNMATLPQQTAQTLTLNRLPKKVTWPGSETAGWLAGLAGEGRAGLRWDNSYFLADSEIRSFAEIEDSLSYNHTSAWSELGQLILSGRFRNKIIHRN
jgi:hypothetical protein